MLKETETKETIDFLLLASLQLKGARAHWAPPGYAYAKCSYRSEKCTDHPIVVN